MSHYICLSGGMFVSLKQLVAWVQTEREGGKGMITVLSEETGFTCNVNQESSFWDVWNYCNVSVTLL